MDANNVTPNDDFDSMASAVYEAIDGSPTQRMDLQPINSHLEPEEDEDCEEDEEDDADDDEEIRQYAKSPTIYEEEHHTRKDDAADDEMMEDDHEDDDSCSLHMENEDDDEYFESNLNDNYPTAAVNKQDPVIVQDESGLIRKIKIPATKLVLSLTDNKGQTLVTKLEKTIKVLPNLSDEKSVQQRSSTPLSREYLALQKSFNDSKILKEFVTEAAEKTRKVRAKDPNSISTPTTPTASATLTDHSYTSRRRSNNQNVVTPEKDTENHSIITSQTKRNHSRRFVPLKAEATVESSESEVIIRRSRSKSMHNSDQSDVSTSSTSHRALKKWPSEERIATTTVSGGRRANMRSENSDFVQKQKDFLQHVINSTQETSMRRSRSRSTGLESTGNGNQSKTSKYKEKSCKRIATGEFDDECDDPNIATISRPRSRSGSAGNASGVESTTCNTSQTKHHKSKDRASKRTKIDVADDDDKLLSQSCVMECTTTTTDDHADDSSVNNSNNSVLACNTSADVSTTTADNADNLEKQLKKLWQPPPKPGSDSFCWKCHESHVNLTCSKCIRSFHSTCAKVKVDSIWICPECTTVDNILNSTKRSRRNELSMDLLSQLLTFALNRMRVRCPKGISSSVMPYEKEVKIYSNIIINPIHFGTLQLKIDSKEYRCAEEFVNDTKWLLHNAYILSSGNSTKTVLATKAILKVCRQEVNEIETCPECYLNANTRDDWFVDVCSQPHLLLWAKLKGFPYWPAKAMGFGQNSLINVRFFGQHDRAFVSVKECFLYSIEDPNIQTGKKTARKLVDCMKEVEEHIEKIKSKVGGFNYAPYKTPFDPTDEMKQLEKMMPGVKEFIKKQQYMKSKPSLQFKIYKTADNNLSIVQKASTTPDHLSPQHQQHQQLEDSNDLHVSTKKKKCTSSTEEEKKSEDIKPVSSAKYEVISKITSDDSNSSKLSTVILKRKSASGDVKKSSEDDNIDLSLPKMQRIEEIISTADDGLNNTSKRKLESGSGEKSKEKHAKHELKIPVITIKTTTTHKDINNLANEAIKSSKEVNGTKEVIATKQVVPAKAQQQTESSNTAQVVENLVKNKQGVTIKKILKEPQSLPTSDTVSPPTDTAPLPNSTTSPAPNSTTISTPQAQPKEKSPDVCKTKETSQNTSPKSLEKPIERLAKSKSDEEKNREEQKVTSILKGLVPFVEIKKEILSDNEEEQAKTTSETLDSKVITDASTSATTTLPDPQSSDQNAKDITGSNNSSPEKVTQAPSTLLTRVKEEIFSDEENENPPQIMQPLNPTSLVAEKSNISQNTHDVRVVGDTIIQKLSSKNANQTSGGTTKRSVLKGIPYGPLPASAFPKLSAESLQNDGMGPLPRAKKSFPQLSPTIDKLRSASGNSSAGMIPSTAANVNLLNQHLDSSKRSMAKTTMVAIPVDVAATSRTSNSMGTMMGSIPVPPLTAVSKTTPPNNTYNSMARNAAATVTVSGTSGSLTCPSVMALKPSAVTSLITPVVSSVSASTSASTSALSSSPSTSTSTSPVMTRNSPITVVSNNSAYPPTISTLTTTASTIQNSVNPLAMSAPPPLAGLSGFNLNNSLPNGSIMSTSETLSAPTVPTTVAGALPQSGSDTHILSGLVTPTLASAITDVICRGPPKLAARPSGPLQSEGYPMFPSQAGPVCKRLVDNAHKLTDFFISVMEDTMGEMALGDDISLQAKLTLATMELERTNLAHETQIAELKRTSDLMLCEMRKSMENEKTRLVNETRKQCELEWKQRETEWKRLVDETKRKQWCAQCGREANFYCCWNTSYCDYPCQQLHWGRHAANCAQTRPSATQEASTATISTNCLQNSSSSTHERHHVTKPNSSSMITPANVNTTKSSSVNHTKKERILTKNASSNHLMAAAMMPIAPSPVTAPSTSRSNNAGAEVLKLPTNTYLRPVTSTLSNQTLRCNTTYSIPVQRFNVPLPITTPANTSNGPQTFTIVHHGNSWVMSSGGSNPGNNSTIAAPIVSVPQIPQHRSSSGAIMTTANKSAKTQIRYH